MRGQTKNAAIETRTERARLRALPHHAPHWRKLKAGLSLGYRKPEDGSAGTWMVRMRDGAGYRVQNLRTPTGAFAIADDKTEADGAAVLSYEDAAEQARLAAKTAGLGDGARKPPVTVAQALCDYERKLIENGRSPLNVKRVRFHLPAALGATLVSKLTVAAFDEWKTKLTETGMARATINRTGHPLRAALNHAADRDERIQGRPWTKALKPLRHATKARNVVLTDEEVTGIVAEAYRRSTEFGLFVEVAAQTGSRPSQIAKLVVADLKLDRNSPRLEMPASAKGDGTPRGKATVPIDLQLAHRLKAVAKDRAGDALLLTRPDGSPWTAKHQELFRATVKRFSPELARDGKDGQTVTIYALRHTHITRWLRAGLGSSVVAKAHDTSTGQIDKHYGAHILKHTDDLMRRCLLEMPAVAVAA